MFNPSAVVFLALLQGVQTGALPSSGGTPYQPGTMYYNPQLHPKQTYLPAVTPDPKYPLRVHIRSNAARLTPRGYVGAGNGRLLGVQAQRIDFTYVCQKPFDRNRADSDFFQARWKKPNEKIELLLMSPTGQKQATCSATVTHMLPPTPANPDSFPAPTN